MKHKIRTVLLWTIIIIVYLAATIIRAACDWFNLRFNVSFEEILFTITSPLAGSDVSFLNEAVEFVIPHFFHALLIIVVGIVVVILLKVVEVNLRVKIHKLVFSFKLYTLIKIICIILPLILLITSIHYGVKSLGLDVYISRRIQKTTIYEEQYVDPSTATITADGQTKNLIYIYLESMETTYASVEDGGAQEINYIPNLTQLAKENISFSDTEKLGGAYVTPGSSWTMGALFSTTTGVPFALPVDGNSMGKYENFAPGITSLGDILENYDYTQVFLCGSDGAFAARETYFEQHGNYKVYDLYYAKEKGYVPEDYFVWWGYEDTKLYDIAKTELLNLSEKEQPFNFTMLTVDTHHIDGYVCENCQSTYDHQLGNVLECADTQILDFIAWCQEQDFYENTVIVISGDHFRMDSSLVDNVERRLYNCILNSDEEVLGSTKNRVFTSLDLFPTTLSAMGFSIEGDRLGLGTDLFSATPTLAEELGLSYLYNELGKYSRYYVENFE